jgi:hypothetical protein
MTLSTLSLRARAVARVAIAAGVLVFCIAADCAVLAFELGRQTGAAVHARNDQLARVARRALAPADPAPAPEPATPAPAPEPVAIEPAPAPEPAPRLSDLFAAAAAELAASDARTYRAIGAHTARVRAILADATPAPAPQTDWAALTVRELRSITGVRSKRLRKADLVALAAGMAV